jgi:hypothetical protein
MSGRLQKPLGSQSVEGVGGYRTIIDTHATRHPAEVNSTMELIRQEAGQFATAMVAGGVVIDQSVHKVWERTGKYDSLEERNVAILPTWAVVTGTNLSGKDMRQAWKMGDTLRGTSMDPVDPDRLEDVCLDPYRRENFRYQEAAIGVTATGGLVCLGRFYHKEEMPSYPLERLPYYVASESVEPRTLFNPEAPIRPERLLAAMRKRLGAAAEAYAKRPPNATPEEVVLRSDGTYYFGRELPGSLPAARSKRSRWRRGR